MTISIKGYFRGRAQDAFYHWARIAVEAAIRDAREGVIPGAPEELVTASCHDRKVVPLRYGYHNVYWKEVGKFHTEEVADRLLSQWERSVMSPTERAYSDMQEKYEEVLARLERLEG